MTTPFSAALMGVPSGTAMSMPSLERPPPLPNVEMTRPRTGHRILPMPVELGAAEAVSTSASSIAFSAFFGNGSASGIAGSASCSALFVASPRRLLPPSGFRGSRGSSLQTNGSNANRADVDVAANPDPDETPGVTVVVRNLADGRDTTFGNVGDAAWQSKGRLLALTIAAEDRAVPDVGEAGDRDAREGHSRRAASGGVNFSFKASATAR